MTATSESRHVIGVGNPIVDFITHVDDQFLTTIDGERAVAQAAARHPRRTCGRDAGAARRHRHRRLARGGTSGGSERGGAQRPHGACP